MAELPERGELVLVTVKKVSSFGALCALDEYGGKEAMCHISEVASGWIRNIREHVKEGQRLVAIVLSSTERGIDISFRRVTQADRERKLASLKQIERVRALCLRAAMQAVPGEKAKALAAKAFEELSRHRDPWDALQRLARGEVSLELPNNYLRALRDLLGEELKPMEVRIRAALTLKSFSPKGLHEIKKTLEAIEESAPAGARFEIHYVSAPNYFLDIWASDYKSAEKAMACARSTLEHSRCVWSLERVGERS